MHNKLRAGVDLELTFKSQMRRLAPTASPDRDKPTPGDSRGKDNVASKGLRARAGKAARSVLGAVVRRLEPVLHPKVFVFRVRRYFTAAIQEEMQTLRVKLQHEIRTQVAELTARLNRRVMAYGGPDEVLVRSDVGYVLCPRPDYPLLVRLLEGERDRGIYLLMQRLLKPGDVFIDVGANVGLHTLAAARAMRGVGRIVAFEPCATTRRLLEASVGLNGFSGIVDIYQAAVSNRTGGTQLLAGATSDHHRRLSLPVPVDIPRAPVEVHCVTLDEILASIPVVNLIRIDAPGAELDVLDGGRSLIRKNEEVALMVKFAPAYLRRGGHTTREWLSRFEALGLVHRVIDDETGVPEPWSTDRLEQVDSVNLLFARPGVDVWRNAAIWR